MPHDRPTDNRPGAAPGSGTLDGLLSELTRARFAYDDLRAVDGSLHDRAQLREQLHDLRQRIARTRCCDLL